MKIFDGAKVIHAKDGETNESILQLAECPSEDTNI